MAAQRSWLRSLNNDRNLRRFVVEAISTGRHLGTGSFGAVEELEVNGQVCAGKRIHEVLLDAGNIGVREIALKYVQECQVMSDLRHPNITLFMGVCFLSNCQLPALVMERLDSSLDDLLESVPNIPFSLKQCILEDIAKGLHYLHKHDPQILHRDLTAKNVLLTSSLVAKITDFGNSRIVNIQPGRLVLTLSQNPGTLVYMPPEALAPAATYGPSLDIFSFGHLGIFVGLQVFPGNLLEPTYTDPKHHGRLRARSEIERREKYIQQLGYQLPRSHDGQEHPFIQLVKSCLQNEPSDRPTSEDLMASLKAMKAGPYEDIARSDAVRQVMIMRAMRKKDDDIKEKAEESAGKDVEIQLLQQELEHEQSKRIVVEEQLQEARTQFQQTTRQALLQKSESNSVIQRLQSELEDKETCLRTQEKKMQQQDEEIKTLVEMLGRCEAQPLRQQKGDSPMKKRSLQRNKGQQTRSEDLKIPLKLRWKQGNDLPLGMAGPIQAVLIGDDVYVGGGASSQSEVVMVHSLTTGSWRTLPPHETKWFGMAAVNNQLVLVGGSRDRTYKATNILAVWDTRLQKWLHPFPAMPTARHSLSVTSHGKWLIAAGGYMYDERDSQLRKVELLETPSGHWYEAPSLPIGCSEMSSAIIGNTWYVLGGFSSQKPHKHVFSVCLDELISCAKSTSQPMTSPWQVLPKTPLEYSTALILNGTLSTLGGHKSPAIHLYQPHSRSWIKACSVLPAQREQCACTVLPNGEVFVAGGRCDQCADGMCKRVDRITVL